MTTSEFARFEPKVEKNYRSGCWNWTARKTPDGYGQMKIGGRAGRPEYAHRLAYEHWVGPIPEGKHLDHLCRNPSCVNPSHLEPVTNRENIRRGLRGVLTTHCPHGHAYDEANTGYSRGTGWRYCRACARRKYHEAKKRNPVGKVA